MVLVLIGAVLVFNLATCNYYPAVWCDEVWFSEPAINLARSGSFVATDWPPAPPNLFPSLNCPLYCIALAPWLVVMGTTLLAIRSFNYSLLAASVFLIWIASWRFGLVKTARARLLMVLVLQMGYGMSFAYRCSRPDLLGVFSLVLLALALQIRRPWLRSLALALLAGITVWIGLQVALFAAFASGLAWLVLRRVAVQDLILLAAGMAAGLGTMLLLFYREGVLKYFLPPFLAVFGKHYTHSPDLSIGGAIRKVMYKSSVSYVDDFSTLVLVVGISILLLLTWKRLSRTTRTVVIFCGTLVFGVPVLFNVAGHYAFYYSYARFIPATLAMFSVYSELACIDRGLSAGLKLLGTGAIALATLVGLPMRLGITMMTTKVVPRSEIQRMIDKCVSREDVVFTHQSFFFEAKRAADTVYDAYYSPAFVPMQLIPGHEFTAEEKQAITVLIVRPGQVEFATNFFGGRWEMLTAPFGDIQDFSALARIPIVGSRFVHYAQQPQTERCQVQILRRIKE